MTSVTNKTYVFNELEVVLTGRTATKEFGKDRRKDVLYEIEPADKNDGSFKKWIHPKELYEIVPLDNETG